MIQLSTYVKQGKIEKNIINKKTFLFDKTIYY